MSCESENCPATCEWIFGSTRVLPLINSGVLVEWLLHPRFRDPGPHTFQLQFSYSGASNSDDWTNVGSPVQDTFAASDPVRRLFGKHQFVYYRLLLTTSVASYYSAPIPYHSAWTWQDQQQIRNIIRQENVRLVQGRAGVIGYLLKRRLHGPRCPECIDPQTQESRNPQCPSCYGTEYLYGYYPPYPCFYVEKGLETVNSQVSNPRNTSNGGPFIRGRMLNVPQVHSFDVWVEKHTDLRWVFREIKSVADVQGRPIVVSVVMGLLPFTHPVYGLTIDGQRD